MSLSTTKQPNDGLADLCNMIADRVIQALRPLLDPANSRLKPAPDTDPTRRESITPQVVRDNFYEIDGKVYRKHDSQGYKAHTEIGKVEDPTSRRGFSTVTYNGIRIQRSHVVFCLHHGRFPIGKIIHADGNHHNDHIDNLYDATSSEIGFVTHHRRRQRVKLPAWTTEQC